MTQHAAAFDPHTLYEMLQCVFPFEGGPTDRGREITALMSNAKLLTDNVRDGVADAWRDYQQVLAEFGLIYSTKISSSLQITDIGHMYLSGLIGYSELMNQQCLRYQYPNGQKFAISSSLRIKLENSAFTNSRSAIELQNICGIRVKPGILILRLLLALEESGQDASLSQFECRKFVMPSHTNDEWPICLAEILSFRSAPYADDDTHSHAKRNIQDWFKFLNQSDIFEIFDSGRSVRLSNLVSDRSDFRSICDAGEKASTFWIAVDDSVSTRLSWFMYYGQSSPYYQPFVSQDGSLTDEYVQQNYVNGIDETDPDDASGISAASQITLGTINLDSLGKGQLSDFAGDPNELSNSIIQGMQKRQAKAILHDQIVKEIGKKLLNRGATISAAHGSVDLFAVWPDNSRTMFEIKTVTRRSLQSRIRSAVGQLQEYQYRQSIQGEPIADLVIAVSSGIDPLGWQSRFVTDHMKMGLLCKLGNTYIGTAPASQSSAEFWTDLS